jgi:hypothetical protein
MIKNRLFYLLLIATCWSCTNSTTEKHQGKRDKVINVREKMKEIEMEDVLISSSNALYLIDDYLIISDYKAPDESIHLFDKTSFSHVTSTAYRGQGPGEIANMGHIGIDEANRRFYVNDHGKYRIFSYELDSVLANPSCMPKEKMKMNERKFPSSYQYVNDTLSIGLIIEPTGISGFKQSVARWNMDTGEIIPMKYKHPEIEKKRISFAASVEHGIYVECYSHHDLMTICTLEGELKYNIYGRSWNNLKSNKVYHYGKVVFCNNRILATYSGRDNFSKEYLPTEFLVFDINGDYIQTLETGYKITDFLYEKENNRIIIAMNDDIQFAYLDLDEIH